MSTKPSGSSNSPRSSSQTNPSKSTKVRTIKRKTEQSWKHLLHEDIQKNASRFLEKALPVEAETSPETVQLHRFMAVLKNIQIRNTRPRLPPTLTAGPLSQVLDLPVRNNRKCYYSIKARESSYKYPEAVWISTIYNEKSARDFSNGGIDFYFPSAYLMKATVKTISAQLVKFIERWPHDVQNGMNRNIKEAIQEAGVQIAYLGARSLHNAVFYSENSRQYTISIFAVHLRTGQPYQQRETVNPATITSLYIPDVPATCVFGKFPKDLEDVDITRPRLKANESVVPRKIDSKLRPQHEAAEKLCRFMSWKLSGKVMEPGALKALCTEYGEVIAQKRRRAKTDTFESLISRKITHKIFSLEFEYISD